MAKKKKSVLQELIDSFKKQLSKDWRKEKVRCCSCGNTWNCVFFNIKGGENKLQCPKCGARNSMVITKK